MTNCQSIKESLRAYLAGSTAVSQGPDSCIITLPIPTLDGRLVDVFIEGTVGDYMVIHDGGKAVNELILQGVELTDSIDEYMESLAKRFQLSYRDESFTVTTRQSQILDKILAIGMCSGLAMGQLIGNVGSLPEEPMRRQFGKALKKWAQRRAKVTSDVVVKGRRGRHRFDFLATLRAANHKTPIAVSVLTPGSNSLAAAERFGYIASDLDNTPFALLPRVAVESRSEAWSAEAKSTVRDCADLVIEIPSESSPTAPFIAEKLKVLAA
jgi:hypothetical protein